jgi:hypothetical protein
MVRPYRGDRYTIDKPFGLSILVLGESSYDCDYNQNGLLPDNWSESIIGHVFRSERDISITRASCVFSGKLQSFAWRQEFWRTAAFTNFVQHSVGSSARQRPTKEKWEFGREALRETLDQLQPQFVLVLGKETWQMEFQRDEFRERRVSLHAETKPFCLRPHVGGFSFVFGINHPASWGWTYAHWSPWVNAALEEARQIDHEATPGFAGKPTHKSKAD